MIGDPFSDNEYEPMEFWPGGIWCCGCGLRGVDVCQPCEEKSAREQNAWAAEQNAKSAEATR